MQTDFSLENAAAGQGQMGQTVSAHSGEGRAVRQALRHCGVI